MSGRTANVGALLAVLIAADVGSTAAFAQKVYWTQSCGFNKINRSNLDGSCVEELVSAVGCPAGIAIDPIARKLYWAEPVQHRIRRSNMDGSEVEIFLSSPDVRCPEGIAIDHVRGMIYWTQACPGSVNRVKRARLDGSCIETIITNDQNGAFATGIALDLTPNSCPLDFDCDGSVGITDLLMLLGGWGSCAGPPTDIDEDGTVGILDLLTLLANWGMCP